MPMYPLFEDVEQEIFGADGVAVPQIRFPNSPEGSYAQFIEEMVYLAQTGIYKGRVLRPRGVSGRVHSMLLSRAGRIANAIGYEIKYKGGLFSTDYVAPPSDPVLPPAPEEEAREEWEDMLFEAAKVLDQDSRDMLFAEMVRLEDANL